MIYRASKNQLCHLLTGNRQADSFYVVVCIISIVFAGHFHNKNTQFYGYRLSSDVKITPFFSNNFFGLHLKFYSQISNCTAAKAQTFRKRCWLNIVSGSKYFIVTAHFRAISQAKTECKNRHILSRFDTCPARPYPQAEKWPYQACYYFKLHKPSEIYP